MIIENKHIIRLSFIGLFLAIIAHIVLYRYFMIKNIVLQEVSTTNSRVAEIYYNQIWQKYSDTTSKLATQDYRTLLTQEDFINFASDSIKFFENIGITGITLYDIEGDKFLASNDLTLKGREGSGGSIYSNTLYTIDAFFLRDVMSVNGLDQALSGSSGHAIFPNAVMQKDDDDSEAIPRTLIVSYIPIIMNFKVIGVMELISDVTEQWDKIGLLEQTVIVTFILVFGIFFAIVMYNTHYAQKIINKQVQINKLLEEAKTRAEGENAAKTEFLANVSHELRTPLNAIIGFSEMMMSETHGKIENPQYLDYVGDINNSGKHLLGVINDILDFSKASVDKLQVDNIEVDLNKVASSSMRFVKPRADSSKIELIEKLPKEHIVISADPKRLKQVFLNLLSNAVKFTPENGSVTLEVEANSLEKLVYVRVIDTGKGMSEKDIPKALSSFGQVDNKPNRQYEGTGLGLPLTKKLVELLNGKFEIQSKVNVGTIVTLTFKYTDSIDFI